MSLITTLVMVGVAATVWTLVEGIASMAHGGEYDKQHSTDLMFRRVALQGATVLILFIGLLSQLR